MKRSIWITLGVIALAAFAISGYAMDAHAVATVLNPHMDMVGGLGMAFLGITAEESKGIMDAITGLNTTFEQFKKTNDERLIKIEKGGAQAGGSAELEAKQKLMFDDMAETKRVLEDLIAKSKRPQILGANGKPIDEKAEAHRSAFGGYLRKGVQFDQEAHEYQSGFGVKSLLAGSGPDGGFAVPKVIDSLIDQTIVNISPIRGIANVIQVSTPDYHKLVNIHGTGSGWVGETDPRPATGTPALKDIVPQMGELYANPQATQQMMDDVFFNAEQWLADEVSLEFARSEGAKFVVGNTAIGPRGFCTYPTAATADSTRPWGTLEYTVTGANGAFKTLSSTVNPADDLYTLVGRMKKGYRANAQWVMNKNTLFKVAAFKDYQGRYVFTPTAAPGVPDTLLGYPITEAEDMIDYSDASNGMGIAFGDFKRGYLIVDRIGTRVIRDPFTNKPYVGFYTTKRLGGSVVNFETIKFLKFATS
jgi:HK97 family phage major capsid protein